MKYNDRELPYLDQPLLDQIFDGVYGLDLAQIEDEALRDFLDMLYTLQAYNHRYRPQACSALFSLFEETVGSVERNSEGTAQWLALGLAVKDLYGMRSSTLRTLLTWVTARK